MRSPWKPKHPFNNFYPFRLQLHVSEGLQGLLHSKVTRLRLWIRSLQCWLQTLPYGRFLESVFLPACSTGCNRKPSITEIKDDKSNSFCLSASLDWSCLSWAHFVDAHGSRGLSARYGQDASGWPVNGRVFLENSIHKPRKPIYWMTWDVKKQMGSCFTLFYYKFSMARKQQDSRIHTAFDTHAHSSWQRCQVKANKPLLCVRSTKLLKSVNIVTMTSSVRESSVIYHMTQYERVLEYSSAVRSWKSNLHRLSTPESRHIFVLFQLHAMWFSFLLHHSLLLGFKLLHVFQHLWKVWFWLLRKKWLHLAWFQSMHPTG